jgi:hypothetical protein
MKESAPTNLLNQAITGMQEELARLVARQQDANLMALAHGSPNVLQGITGRSQVWDQEGRFSGTAEQREIGLASNNQESEQRRIRNQLQHGQ